MVSSASKNRAFVLRAINDAGIEERPPPKDQDLADDEVLVAPKVTGICGSDVHYYTHGRIGDFVLREPMILGHESSGVVVRVGKKVLDLKEGDRVAMEPGETCRKCDACKMGRYQLCPDVKFAATPPYDGTLASFYRLPADLAYKLPERVSLEDGALIEPLAVAVQAVHKAGKLQSNQNIAVFGAGPVGLLCMAVAKALGARRILAIDIVAGRLEFAKSYIATDTCSPSAKKEGEDAVGYADRQAEEMREALKIEPRGIEGIDLVVDATGAPPCIQTGLLLCKEGGTYVQVGMGPPNVEIPITALLTKGLSVQGSFRYGPGDYRLAIAFVEQGRIDLKPLVSHRYSFDDALKAYQAMVKGKGEDGKPPIKVLIGGADE